MLWALKDLQEVGQEQSHSRGGRAGSQAAWASLQGREEAVRGKQV